MEENQMSFSKLHGYLSPNQSLSKEVNRSILVELQREKHLGSNCSLEAAYISLDSMKFLHNFLSF